METTRSYSQGIRDAAALVRDAGPANADQKLLLTTLAGSLEDVADHALRNEGERARLEREVVEAAKARRVTKLAAPGAADDYIKTLHATMLAEHAAVDALLEFEAKHKGAEGDV